MVQFSSVQFSRLVVSASLRPHGLQHTRPSCLSPTPGACSNSCPWSRWWHPTISFSIVPFSCLQYFPASGSFPMSQLLCPPSIGAWMKPALSFLWLSYLSAFVDNHPHSDGLLSFLDMMAYFILFRQVWWEPFSSWWLWISPLWFIMCWFSIELQNDF